MHVCKLLEVAYVCYVFQVFGESFKNQTINSVDDKLLKAGDQLEYIDPEKQHCLKTFTNCIELVKWLRENIKGKARSTAAFIIY